MDLDSPAKVQTLDTLDVEDVVDLLRSWDLREFVEFVRERQVDGRKLADVTEGLVKLWRPKVNAKKLIQFVEDAKLNPGKYFGEGKSGQVPIECQYQTVRKIKSEASTANTRVEELLKKLVPAKSFLYRHQSEKAEKIVPSYLPMDGGTKHRKFFRFSLYEYPYLNAFSKYSKHETQEDRGYYSIQANSKYLIQKVYRRQESRTKYKSLPVTEDVIEKLPEDHFYEDLCYNEVNANEDLKTTSLNQIANGKPCLVKLQELFQSFKMPFFKKPSEAESAEVKANIEKELNKEIDTYLYDNELAGNMYDSVHVVADQRDIEDKNKAANIPVEEYLEPVQLSKDYCDIAVRQKEESLMGYIMSLFEKRFRIKRETSDSNLSEESDIDGHAEDDRCKDNTAKCNENDDRKSNKMADRPLPVPVENEPYYMNVDRAEAENLLKGQPDGTFILRPSSQSNHAYTLSVACTNQVHNVGVRRRPDGRLALGFPRRGERSFQSVPSLLRHHKRRRLLLVAAGGVVGATTLNEAADYYQTPTSIPVLRGV